MVSLILKSQKWPFFQKYKRIQFTSGLVVKIQTPSKVGSNRKKLVHIRLYLCRVDPFFMLKLSNFTKLHPLIKSFTFLNFYAYFLPCIWMPIFTRKMLLGKKKKSFWFWFLNKKVIFSSASRLTYQTVLDYFGAQKQKKKL